MSFFQPVRMSEQAGLENEVLKTEINYLKNEINILSKQTEFIVNENYQYLMTRISFRNPYTFYETMTIPKGSKDNIEKGMAIIGQNGLIGIVKEVNKNSSKIDLITNNNNEISIVVHNSYGILSGYSNSEEALIIKTMNNYDNIEIGDLVYTSGLGSLPSGILIGKVKKIEYDNYEIEQKIYINSKNDLDNINIVAVLLSVKEE